MRILAYLRRQGNFRNGGEIERLAESSGYKASNASRRCRELENEGLIERKMVEGPKTSSVWYRAIIANGKLF